MSFSRHSYATRLAMIAPTIRPIAHETMAAMNGKRLQTPFVHALIVCLGSAPVASVAATATNVRTIAMT